MPQSWHTDVPLSNYAQKYGQFGMGWQAMAPVVPVDKMSNKFVKWNREEIRYADVKPRAPRTPAARIGIGSSTGTYMTAEVPVAGDISWDEPANADAIYGDPSTRLVEVLKAQGNLYWENVFKGLATTSGNFGTSNAVSGNAWLTATYATLRADFDTAIEGVSVKSGFAPNKILLSPTKAKELARNSNIIDIVKYKPATDLIADGSLPKMLFGLEVIVPGVISESANEGQTSSPARLWSNTTAIIAYVDPNPGTERMTWMSTFTWKDWPGSSQGEQVRFWDEPAIRTRVYEYGSHRQVNVVASVCAAQVTGI